jgi:hypothetical protein
MPPKYAPRQVACNRSLQHRYCGSEQITRVHKGPKRYREPLKALVRDCPRSVSAVASIRNAAPGCRQVEERQHTVGLVRACSRIADKTTRSLLWTWLYHKTAAVAVRFASFSLRLFEAAIAVASIQQPLAPRAVVTSWRVTFKRSQRNASLGCEVCGLFEPLRRRHPCTRLSG